MPRDVAVPPRGRATETRAARPGLQSGVSRRARAMGQGQGVQREGFFTGERLAAENSFVGMGQFLFDRSVVKLHWSQSDSP